MNRSRDVTRNPAPTIFIVLDIFEAATSLAFFNFEGLGDVGSMFNLLPVTELSAESVENAVDND